MDKDTGTTGGSATQMGFGLEDLIRRGARQVIQAAIEVEVRELISQYSNVRTLTGAAAVVRNGYLPARDPHAGGSAGGARAQGAVAQRVSRLKAEWAGEYTAWMKRDLTPRRYVYWWARCVST